MASILSAGTTTATGLNFSADTTGILQLASNNGTVGLTMDTSQNVGIGTTSPTSKLQVSGTTGFVGAGYYQVSGGAGVYGTNTIFYSGGGDISLAVGTNSGGYVYQTVTTNHALTFGTNNTERARIDSSGNVTLQKNISVGAAAPTTSGTGITFPATQSASTDANTLDDYEEGTWTPVINPATGTVTSSVTAGTYIKVGRQVTLNYNAQITGGTITAVSSISGFPFATGSASVSASGACREYAAAGQLWCLTSTANATNGALINYVNSNVVTNTYAWSGTFVYQV
jgi:hypothetical protein